MQSNTTPRKPSAIASYLAAADKQCGKWPPPGAVRVDSLRKVDQFRCIGGEDWEFVRHDGGNRGAYVVRSLVNGATTWFAGCAEVVRLEAPTGPKSIEERAAACNAKYPIAESFGSRCLGCGSYESDNEAKCIVENASHNFVEVDERGMAVSR